MIGAEAKASRRTMLCYGAAVSTVALTTGTYELERAKNDRLKNPGVKMMNKRSITGLSLNAAGGLGAVFVSFFALKELLAGIRKK